MSNAVKYGVCLPLIVLLPIVLWCLPITCFGMEGLTVVQQRMIAIFVFAALSWIMEVIPNWVTSLIVIVLMLLTVSTGGLSCISPSGLEGLVNYKHIMAAFADPVIMLFLGGFVLAHVAGKYGMDAVIAKSMLAIFGTRPQWVLLGFLITIALFSMFMSNTATAAMMLAFLAPVLKSLPEEETGRVGFALAIPFAANLGGIGTPIGTPPNAIAVGALQNAGYTITFGGWMAHMVPYMLIMLLIAWGLLLFFFPFKSNKIELHIPVQNRKMDAKAWIAWITFFATILLWVTESLTGINSNIVALIPVAIYTMTGVFTSDDLKEIDWSVLWLVAGGFALGTGLEETGLAQTMIHAIPFEQMNVVLVIVIAGLVCYGLSNFISNSATAALLIPIMVVVGHAMEDPTAANHEAFAAAGGMDTLIPFVAICASLAMILPISTPPNAIAASTKMVTTAQMAKVGVLIGIIGFALAYFIFTKIAF